MFAYPKLFASVILLGVITQGIATSLSFFTMFIIDSITSGNMANLITSAYMGAVVILLFYFFLWAFAKIAVYYQFKTTLKLKRDIFCAILETKISDFNQINSAKHISLINNDIQVICSKYFNGILEMIKFIITIVFALIAMAFLSPVNAAIALVLSSAPLILPMIFGNKLAKTNMIHMEKMASLNEKVKDFLSGFEVIKTFGIEKNIREKFFKSTSDAEIAKYVANKVSVNMGALSGTFMIATQILTYLVAGYFVIRGNITIGAVIAISGLSGSIIGPMQYLSMNLAQIKSTKEVREGLLQVMEPKDSHVRSKIADFSSGIKINNLSFMYEPLKEKTSDNKNKTPTIKMMSFDGGKNIEEIMSELGVDPKEITVLDGSNISKESLDGIIKSPEMALSSLTTQIKPDNTVLKNVSFTFKPHGKYAIVGGSGSGKSTLLRVLLGYYDNYKGNVLVGEDEIRDINRESLYQSLSMMHQNVFMLDDTLQNNITLYNSYPDKEYLQAIENAQLSELVQSASSSVNIGEGGNVLSGGERQRVAIARALLKGSKVIILDEATANLDNETAYSIENSLLETSDITCIFVTHRYTKELLQKCDAILVMRDGQIVESGTFDELYHKKDYFYSLYNISGRG